MNLEKVLLVIWIIDAVACTAVLYIEYRKKHPKPGDTCKYLKRKKGFFHGGYRYYCGIYAGICDPPEYCSDWDIRNRKYNYTDEPTETDGGTESANEKAAVPS